MADDESSSGGYSAQIKFGNYELNNVNVHGLNLADEVATIGNDRHSTKIPVATDHEFTLNIPIDSTLGKPGDRATALSQLLTWYQFTKEATPLLYNSAIGKENNRTPAGATLTADPKATQSSSVGGSSGKFPSVKCGFFGVKYFHGQNEIVCFELGGVFPISISFSNLAETGKASIEFGFSYDTIRGVPTKKAKEGKELIQGMANVLKKKTPVR
jgi:hypothetical protein